MSCALKSPRRSFGPIIYCTDKENKTFILHKVEQQVSDGSRTIILIA